MDEWRASARVIPLLEVLLVELHPEVELRYLFAGMAAFHGYQWLAQKHEKREVISDRKE